MTRKVQRDPPREIKELLRKSYARVERLNAKGSVRGWYKELMRLYKLSVDHNLGLHSDHPNIIVIRKARGTTIVHRGGPTASFVVNVNAPDAIIYAQFDRWLEEVRKQFKPHVAKPGQHAPNGEFDKKKFRSWQSVGVVPFVDLLTWRAKLDPIEQKKFLKSDLGWWIGRFTSKDVNTTERITEKALASLVSLGAQLEHEIISRDQSSSALVAARIAKEVANQPVLTIRRIAGSDT